ncbi:hypothetical protein CPB85DRAFT_259935 [Mucidula mucida]|nr:hypothetical protein CPB85DRAFT_259935 [Mucidula mucida]
MSTKDYYSASGASYTSLILGVIQSSAGVTISVAAVAAYKLFPSLCPPAPEFRRTPSPTCNQRRSRRSSVDTMATEASDISLDSVSTLVEPENKRKRRLSAASLSEPFIKLAKTTKNEIRPLTRRSFTAISSPFTASTTSLHIPRATSTHVKAAIKNARRNSADMFLLHRKTAAPFTADFIGDGVVEPSPLVRQWCSLVPEECALLEQEVVEPFVEESLFVEDLSSKKRKVFRPVKMGKKFSRVCVQVFS